MTDRHVSHLELSAFPGAPLHFAALTDVGQVREQNEDACGVRTSQEGPLPVEAVLIAADGVGGHVGGAVASRFVVDAVRDTFADQDSIEHLASWMEKLLQSVHRELLREAKGRGMNAAMGSTATVAAVQGTRLVLAHVGDSRAYRLRGGQLTQLTEDDSWVAEQMRAGLLTREEMATNPQKNVLTQCLGIGESLRVHSSEETLEVGDRYLLCSDGLHGEVDDPGMQAVLATEADPAVAAQTLIDMANAKGAPDNVTAVVFDIGSVPGTRPSSAAPPTSEDAPTYPDADVPSIESEFGGPADLNASGPSVVGRPGASWAITAGLALLITGGVAASWSTLRPASAAVPNPAPAALQGPAATEASAQPAPPVEATEAVRPPLTADTTGQPDTMPADPPTPDSTIRDTVGSPDSLVPDTVVPGAVVPDTVVPETPIPDTALPIRPDTSSGPSLQE